MDIHQVDNLNDLVHFAAVVRYAGFSSAARMTGVEKTRLSRRVTALERRLGVRLLNRNTRHIALTEAGERFYVCCLRMLEEVNAAYESVADLRSEPAGNVRLLCPQVMAQSYLTQILLDYLSQHPKVNLEVESSDQEIGLIDGRYDLALRASPRIEATSGFVARPLSSARRILVASPGFLVRTGGIENPETIKELDTIARQGDIRDGQAQWRLVGPENFETLAVHTPRLVSDDLRLQLEAAIQGIGIALLPDQIVAGVIEKGDLQQVLAGWVASPNLIHLIYPIPRGMLPSVRSLIDHLALRLPEALGSASSIAERIEAGRAIQGKGL